MEKLRKKKIKLQLNILRGKRKVMRLFDEILQANVQI